MLYSAVSVLLCEGRIMFSKCKAIVYCVMRSAVSVLLCEGRIMFSKCKVIVHCVMRVT